MSAWQPIETAPVDDVIVGMNMRGDRALIWRFEVPRAERWLTYYGTKVFCPLSWRPNEEPLE